jgi:mannose-1-phosphate guanylyltransferase
MGQECAVDKRHGHIRSNGAHAPPPGVLRDLAGGSTLDPPAFCSAALREVTTHLNNPPLWCIVQADGDRLVQTSRGAMPIQYCCTRGCPSPIQRSLHRALRITKPRQVVATVAELHRGWWQDLLWCIPPHRRIVDESSGRPTVTLAAALAVIEREAGDPLLVLQPADTFHASESAFIAGVAQAIRTLDSLPGHVVTLTIEGYATEPGQDYLLLGAEDELPGRSAVRFIKRPLPLIAERLLELGACLSTGVYIARLSTLSVILSELWPDLIGEARVLAATAAREVLTPARMYGSQFCRPWRHTWVQRPLPRLRAVAVDELGWSAVASTLENTAAARSSQ